MTSTLLGIRYEGAEAALSGISPPGQLLVGSRHWTSGIVAKPFTPGAGGSFLLLSQRKYGIFLLETQMARS